MNDRDAVRDGIRDEQMDLLLREVEGNECPPDLVVRILERAAHHDHGDASIEFGTSTGPEPRRWLVAAILILGVGLTWTVVTRKQVDPSDASPIRLPAQGRELPDPVEVRSAAELRQVAEDTRDLRGIGLTDGDLSGLARLRELRRLELAAPAGTGEPRITDAGIPHLAMLTKLEALVMRDSAVRGHGMARLAALPALRSLDLRGSAVDAAGMAEIARLRSLTRLDVGDVSGFGDAQMEHVLGMRGLRWLCLANNGLIGAAKLRGLGALDQLEHLDVSGIHGAASPAVHVRRGGVLFSGHLTAKSGAGVGVDDRVLEVLGTKLPRLRRLILAGCKHVTSEGLGHVLALPHLTGLDLRDCQLLTRADIQKTLERGGWKMLGLPTIGREGLDGPGAVFAMLPGAARGLEDLRLSGVGPDTTVHSAVAQLAMARVQDFSVLGGLPDLRALFLDRVVVEPAACASLNALQRLREFRARECPIDVAALADLKARVEVFQVSTRKSRDALLDVLLDRSGQAGGGRGAGGAGSAGK